ncbi:MAG: hypothetical protein JWN84_3004 [Nocardioides sp.]|nr:hypothetical protein [Nocardioides sp.]
MDTSGLQDLYQQPGPFATVLVDVSRDSENGEHEHELRVRDAVGSLEEQGASADVVSAVRGRLLQPPGQQAPVARLVVASAAGVLLAETAGFRADLATATWGPLPDLAAWVEHCDSTLRFVLAIVDHVGGDVAVMDSDVPEAEESVSVGGETHHAHKVPVGGWSALRYQHVTENVWAENAQAVADRIKSHVRRGLGLVLLAGDPQSRPRVVGALGDLPVELIELETGTRAEDGGDESHQQAIREALMGVVVQRRTALAHDLRERTGQGRAVATGIDEVAEAFVRGQVDTLLLDPAAASEAELDPRQHRGLVLGGTGAEQPVRADLALVAAAVATAAKVSVLPKAVLGGQPIAALLRWDQEAS